MKEIKVSTFREQDDNQAAQNLPDKQTQEVDALKACEERYQRLAADFENYKKRVRTEWAELEDKVEAKILDSVLPIYDDFIRLKNHTTETEHLAHGVEAVQKKWQTWLESRGVKLMHPEGEEFDHNLHEAVLHQPVDDPELDGKIVNVLEHGYWRHDKVLRHAKVVVGRYMPHEAQEILSL
jgi:molecular chaperone GrpE